MFYNATQRAALYRNIRLAIDNEEWRRQHYEPIRRLFNLHEDFDDNTDFDTLWRILGPRPYNQQAVPCLTVRQF